ncbi:MAG: hypothetical protein AB8G95_05380 [Anaerolineae bacterium]
MNKAKNIATYLKILLFAATAWIGLANFAFVPHWINEMVGLTALNTKMPETIILGSIFVFAVTLAFIFFNRLFAVSFELLEEAAS